MSDRTTYYSGSLKIELEQTGISKDGRDVFKGTIMVLASHLTLIREPFVSVGPSHFVTIACMSPLPVV